PRPRAAFCGAAAHPSAIHALSLHDALPILRAPRYVMCGRTGASPSRITQRVAGAEATENAVTVSAVRKSTGRGNGKGLKLRTGALNGPRTAASRPFREPPR